MNQEYYEILEEHLSKFIYIRIVALAILCFGLYELGFLYSFAAFVIGALVEIELINIYVIQGNRNRRLLDLESCCEENMGNEAGSVTNIFGKKNA